jgi:sulfur carrier protein
LDNGVEATIRLNGSKRPLRERSLVGLLREFGCDPELPGIAVAINGEVVPRREWSDRAVEPGDSIEIVTAVQGG